MIPFVFGDGLPSLILVMAQRRTMDRVRGHMSDLCEFTLCLSVQSFLFFSLFSDIFHFNSTVRSIVCKSQSSGQDFEVLTAVWVRKDGSQLRMAFKHM